MNDYIPNTEEVRQGYAVSLAEFDRWLAAHDREVAERAWDEGFTAGHYTPSEIEQAAPAAPDCQCRDNPHRRA